MSHICGEGVSASHGFGYVCIFLGLACALGKDNYFFSFSKCFFCKLAGENGTGVHQYTAIPLHTLCLNYIEQGLASCFQYYNRIGSTASIHRHMLISYVMKPAMTIINTLISKSWRSIEHTCNCKNKPFGRHDEAISQPES